MKCPHCQNDFQAEVEADDRRRLIFQQIGNGMTEGLTRRRWADCFRGQAQFAVVGRQQLAPLLFKLRIRWGLVVAEEV